VQGSSLHKDFHISTFSNPACWDF